MRTCTHFCMYVHMYIHVYLSSGMRLPVLICLWWPVQPPEISKYLQYVLKFPIIVNYMQNPVFILVIAWHLGSVFLSHPTRRCGLLKYHITIYHHLSPSRCFAQERAGIRCRWMPFPSTAVLTNLELGQRLNSSIDARMEVAAVKGRPGRLPRLPRGKKGEYQILNI